MDLFNKLIKYSSIKEFLEQLFRGKKISLHYLIAITIGTIFTAIIIIFWTQFYKASVDRLCREFAKFSRQAESLRLYQLPALRELLANFLVDMEIDKGTDTPPEGRDIRPRMSNLLTYLKNKNDIDFVIESKGDGLFMSRNIETETSDESTNDADDENTSNDNETDATLHIVV